jgi:dTDP-4-dehydrorhamnose reductase
VQTVEHLCRALGETGALLIALSSDYVFDGAKGSPYDEEDEPNPLSVYGRTKLAGERVALSYPNAVVVRPSTLFGPGRTNFCDAIVERFRRDEPVEAFVDQVTSPTYTEDLAEGLRGLVDAMAARSLKQLPRIYHMTNAGGASRVEFSTYVAGLVGRPASLIKPIQMQDQRRPAPRPANSALTSRVLQDTIGRTLRPWQESVRAYLASRGWLN